jgi:hypothetical protein
VVELPGQYLSHPQQQVAPFSPHPTLEHGALGDIELPGQYLSGLEVNPDTVLCCALPPPAPTTTTPQDVALGDVELPGQYLSGLEVNPDSIIYLEGIGADVAIVRRNSSSFRRLSLLCSDGHTRHMLVQVRATGLAGGGVGRRSWCLGGGAHASAGAQGVGIFHRLMQVCMPSVGGLVGGEWVT